MNFSLFNEAELTFRTHFFSLLYFRQFILSVSFPSLFVRLFSCLCCLSFYYSSIFLSLSRFRIFSHVFRRLVSVASSIKIYFPLRFAILRAHFTPCILYNSVISTYASHPVSFTVTISIEYRFAVLPSFYPSAFFSLVGAFPVRIFISFFYKFLFLLFTIVLPNYPFASVLNVMLYMFLYLYIFPFCYESPPFVFDSSFL